ncbi:MAG: hypothetical protein ABI402_07295 [Ferruginibacter sp.]
MREYSFDYANQRNALLLIALCIFSGILTIFISIVLTNDHKANHFIVIVAAAAIPIAIFYHLKKRVSKSGFACFDDDRLEITLDNRKTEIFYYDLNSYKFYTGKKGATLFTLNFESDKKLKILSHPSYSNTESFNFFCKIFESKMEEHKGEGKTNVIKQKLLFGQ